VNISEIYQNNPEDARRLLSQKDVSVDWGSRKVSIEGQDYGSIDAIANSVLNKSVASGTALDLEITQLLNSGYSTNIRPPIL
jgi:hypothetical protein